MSFIHGRIGTFKVQGEATPIYFNLNTCAYFDAHSKTRLIPILLNVFEAVSQAKDKNVSLENVAQAVDGSDKGGLDIQVFFEHIDLSVIRLLAAAALHRYDRNDEPEHPYSAGQLGAYLTMEDWGKLLPILQKGAMSFLANKSDMPKSMQDREPEDDGKENPTGTPPTSGGVESSDLDVEILGSLEESSEEKPFEVSVSDGKPGS